MDSWSVRHLDKITLSLIRWDHAKKTGMGQSPFPAVISLRLATNYAVTVGQIVCQLKYVEIFWHSVDNPVATVPCGNWMYEPVKDRERRYQTS